jgi:DNA-directed RNA polymerase subunit RPC12/RpoP
MPIEKTNCISCGAPLQVESYQELIICNYCSTTNRIMRDQKGDVAAINSQALDYIAKEAIISKNERNLENLSQKKIELLEARERAISDKKLERENETKSVKDETSLNKKEWTLGVLGALTWLAGVFLIIIAILNNDWGSICLILPGGLVLGTIFVWIAGSLHVERTKKELSPILAELDKKYQSELDEIEQGYDNEVLRINNEIDKSQSLVSIHKQTETEGEKRVPLEQLGFGIRSEIRKMIRDGHKVNAVKFLREKTNLGLREALEYVEKIEKGS